MLLFDPAQVDVGASTLDFVISDMVVPSPLQPTRLFQRRSIDVVLVLEALSKPNQVACN